MSMEFVGKFAVVTGGGAGIGRAICKALAENGARVSVVDLDGQAARETASAIGRGANAHLCDVSDQTAMKGIFESFGSIPDFLINNAGVVSGPGQPFTRNSEADWDRAFAINVKSIVHACGLVYDGMCARGSGRIVNISSITGIIAAPFMPPYSVSKSAANSLTRVLARQFAPFGVTVNAVCPGFVWSPLWENLGEAMAQASGGAQGRNSREVFDGRIESLVPMKRPQTPDEIAATVSFLCSGHAGSITGQVIAVDGGVTI
jgi:NAD(P)-dependent dehydrogenase (short-subunit alcohol dehydrogenase family)